MKITSEKQALKFIKSGYWISEIPYKFITEELCIEYIKRWRLGFKIIEDIAPKFITEKLLIELIKMSKYGINNIPDKLLTKKLKLLHEACWLL